MQTYVPNLRPLPPLAERTVPAVLMRALATAPDKIALEEPGRSLTYREAVDEALRLAGGLRRLGIGRQEPVLLMLDNNIDYVLSWLALGLTGRIEVPVNTAYVGTILAHVINNSGARIMVVDARFLPAIAQIADKLEHLETLVVCGPPAASPLAGLRHVGFGDLRSEPEEIAAIQPWDIIGIMYTSGTTGLSKGVRVTHAHAYGYCSPAILGGCTEDDRSLVVLPLFHVGGQWAGVYNALIAGATAVILPRFSAQNFWNDVRAYKCTYTLILGAMVEFLLAQPPRTDDADHMLKRIMLIPISNGLENFRQRFGIETASSGYGSTEASTVLVAPPGMAQPGKIGWCRPDMEVLLVDENDIEVPRGASGELVIRAKEPWVMMAGYHGMPEATEAAWRNLWFHTGDIMRQDEKGMFAFVDRRKDVIRRRGENVSTFEVEQEIIVHPSVKECAVVAVPSEATEDDILACVVLADGHRLEATDLHEHLKPRLPYFMVPRYIRFMDNLPKTPTEKIRKEALREAGITADTFDAGSRRS